MLCGWIEYREDREAFRRRAAFARRHGKRGANRKQRRQRQKARR